MASAMMLRAAAGATALATGPAPRVASPAVVLVSRTARRCVAAQAAKLDKPNRLWVSFFSNVALPGPIMLTNADLLPPAAGAGHCLVPRG